MTRRLALALVLLSLTAPAAARADAKPVEVPEAVGKLLSRWQLGLAQPQPRRTLDAATPRSAPAASFERGPEKPAGRMVLQLPVLSF